MQNQTYIFEAPPRHTMIYLLMYKPDKETNAMLPFLYAGRLAKIKVEFSNLTKVIYSMRKEKVWNGKKYQTIKDEVNTLIEFESRLLNRSFFFDAEEALNAYNKSL